MKYDVALLTSREACLLMESGIAPARPWMTYKQAPYRQVVLPDGRKVGFIVFPPLPKGSDLPDGGTFLSISKAVTKAKARAELVVALSDWGIVAEREYLAKAPMNMPHILLGSGMGTGIRGQVMADGRILYARSYTKGKAVNTIEVGQWPAKNDDFRWIRGVNITPSLTSLTDRYYGNLKINEIFSNVDQSNNIGGVHNVQRSFYRPIDPIRERRGR